MEGSDAVEVRDHRCLLWPARLVSATVVISPRLVAVVPQPANDYLVAGISPHQRPGRQTAFQVLHAAPTVCPISSAVE